MFEGIGIRIVLVDTASVCPQPQASPFVFVDTDDWYIAQSVGIVARNIRICFHENFFDTDHTASDCPYPDIILFVFIDAFDGIYRKRVPVSRRMDNGCNIGGVFQIHNIDSSAIGRYPEFVIYL